MNVVKILCYAIMLIVILLVGLGLKPACNIIGEAVKEDLRENGLDISDKTFSGVWTLMILTFVILGVIHGLSTIEVQNEN